MRLVLSTPVFLLTLSSLSPALGQTTPVKAKASDSVPESEAPEVAEAAAQKSEKSVEKDSADEASEGSESSEDEAPPEEAVPTPESGDGDEPAKTESASSEKRIKGAPTKAKEKPAASDAEGQTDDKEEPEGETETESGSPDDATPEDAVAAGEADADDPDASKSAPVRSKNPAHDRLGFVFAPRLGLTVGGAAHLGSECEETGNLGCGTFGIRDHKEASGFAIAADALYGLIPELRLGASLMWLPQAKGDAGGELRRLGTEVQLQAVAEGVFDLMDRLAVTVRVQGGGTVLAPGGFVDDVVKEAQDDCEVARDAGIDCTVHDGPYFAPVFGGGAGLLVQTKGAARLRLDFLFETQTLPIYEQKAASDAGTVDATVTMDQSRFWLLAGFEI